MKVVFEHKGGKREPMHERYAIILQKLGRGTYMTRDMQAEPVLQVDPVTARVEPVEPDEKAVETVEQSDGLDELTAEELHILAEKRGIKVHKRSGAEKVKQALRESAE